MLIVNAEVRVADGTLEQMKEAVAAMEIESRKEPGCYTYAFSVDLNDPTMVRITERWESRADLEAHFGMPHMAVFAAALGEIKPLSIDAHAYELGEEVPLPGS